MVNQGRRRHYRVQTGDTRGLSAQIGARTDGGKGQRSAEVLNTSAGGVGLELAESASRWLNVDGEVLVDFKRRGRERPYQAAARVVRLEPSPVKPDRVRVGLSFIEPRRFHAQLDSEAWRFFNRRRCLLYTSPSPRDRQKSRMPSSA